jgi:hypothetical protein
VDFAKAPPTSASENSRPLAPEQEHAPASEAIAPPTNLPTPEEAAGDPLVKAVLEVFDGTVKQVYPRK